MNDRYRADDGQPGNPTVATPPRTPLRDIRKRLPPRVLSEADLRQFQTRGYVVVRQAVSAEQVRRTVDYLWKFQELDPALPDTWDAPERRSHGMRELNGSGMVEAYHHQTLWDNRQTPRVHDAFVDLWDEQALWVTLDRANLNTPNRGQRRFPGFIHWDADTTLTPLPVNLQGVLALSDTNEDVGGFQCIPDLFEHFDDWRRAAPPDRHAYRPDLATVPWPVRFVPVQAGDLLIFDSLLAHGIRPNLSERGVRIAQYISFAPADDARQALRDDRVRSWRSRSAPVGLAFPGDPRGWEQTRERTAELSELGEKILGLRAWGT